MSTMALMIRVSKDNDNNAILEIIRRERAVSDALDEYLYGPEEMPDDHSLRLKVMDLAWECLEKLRQEKYIGEVPKYLKTKCWR